MGALMENTSKKTMQEDYTNQTFDVTYTVASETPREQGGMGEGLSFTAEETQTASLPDLLQKLIDHTLKLDMVENARLKKDGMEEVGPVFMAEEMQTMPLPDLLQKLIDHTLKLELNENARLEKERKELEVEGKKLRRKVRKLKASEKAKQESGVDGKDVKETKG